MFHWLEARAFAHATEDEERVVAALRTLLPEGEVRREKLEGHFGNPLLMLAVRAERAEGIRAVWRRIVDALGRDAILGGLEERVDEDGLYHLRVDKQQASLGMIAPPSDGDVIDVRAKVAAYPKKREIALRVLREFVEGL